MPTIEMPSLAGLETAAENLLRARQHDVLLVEDNAAHAALIRRAFTEPQWLVEHVTRASAAELSFAANPQRIVILDLTLPDSTGLALLGKLKALNEKAPIIIVTSLEQVSVSVEAMRLGAWDYVVKGEPQETLDHIRSAVERAWQKRLVQAQDALIEQSKIVEALRAQRLEAIELVVRTVCHEVNNPLSGVVALSQLLEQRAQVDQDLKRLAEGILSSAKEVARVVQKLHTISDYVVEFGGQKILDLEAATPREEISLVASVPSKE